MLSETEVSGLLSELAGLHPDDGFDPSGAHGWDYHCSFLDSNKEYKQRAFTLMKVAFSQAVARYLTGYRMLSCNFYVKPSGRGELPVHQNWPVLPNIDDTTVTIWCPLVDATYRNGTIQIVPSSHKILPYIESSRSPAYFTNFRPVPMPAGHGLIFDDSLVHYSAKNSSDEPRIAVQILCIPVDVAPVYFYLDREGGECFELIRAEENFWLETHPFDLQQRQPHWETVGFLPNTSRLITEPEFRRLLFEGDRTRRQIYAAN
jgi:hypothetical protein